MPTREECLLAAALAFLDVLAEQDAEMASGADQVQAVCDPLSTRYFHEHITTHSGSRSAESPES